MSHLADSLRKEAQIEDIPDELKTPVRIIDPMNYLRTVYGDRTEAEIAKADEYNRRNNIPYRMQRWKRPVHQIKGDAGYAASYNPYMQRVALPRSALEVPIGLGKAEDQQNKVTLKPAEVALHELTHYVTAGSGEQYSQLDDLATRIAPGFRPMFRRAPASGPRLSSRVDRPGEELQYPEVRAAEIQPPLHALQAHLFRTTGKRIESPAEYDAYMKPFDRLSDKHFSEAVSKLPAELQQLHYYRRNMLRAPRTTVQKIREPASVREPFYKYTDWVWPDSEISDEPLSYYQLQDYADTLNKRLARARDQGDKEEVFRLEARRKQLDKWLLAPKEKVIDQRSGQQRLEDYDKINRKLIPGIVRREQKATRKTASERGPLTTALWKQNSLRKEAGKARSAGPLLSSFFSLSRGGKKLPAYRSAQQIKDLKGRVKAKLRKLIQEHPFITGGPAPALPLSLYGLFHRKTATAAQDFAPGLPRKDRLGDLEKLPRDKALTYVLQRHLAHRAGPHLDLRFGSPELGLYSWAIPAAKMPKPGEKRLAVQQPVHKHKYRKFTGTIPRGVYGAGEVSREDEGEVRITKVEPAKINFVITHKKHPEMFSLVKVRNKNDWLLVNTTPQSSEALQENRKVHYTKVDPEKVEDFLNGDYAVSAKIDGAAALFQLFRDRIEAVSYRAQKGTDKPIVHTYRIPGSTGVDIPEGLEGTILRGEIYGERGGKAIPPQELGGLLNMATAKSRKAQEERDVRLKAALFNIYRLGHKGAPPEDYAERMELLQKIVKQMPKQTFTVPPTETDPEKARALYESIKTGAHPLTEEGIVATPLRGGGKPAKVKFREDADVFIRDVVPAETKTGKPRAGAVKYSLSPSGPVVGEVGTGFSHELARELLRNKQDYIGRRARIAAQGQFPGGAYRAPSFTALHEG